MCRLDLTRYMQFINRKLYPKAFMLLSKQTHLHQPYL